MYCTNCRKEIVGNAKFCTFCGTPVESPVPQTTVTPAYSHYSTPGTVPHVYNNFYAPRKTPISVGGWIGRSLILLIPLVGGLVYFIMLFVWAGDKTKEESFSNWAKAQLIVMLIGLIIVLFIIFAASSFFIDTFAIE